MEEKQPLFYWSGVSNGVSGITTPGAGQIRSSRVLVPQSQPVLITVSVATCNVQLLRKGNRNGSFFHFLNRCGVGHVCSFIVPTPQ